MRFRTLLLGQHDERTVPRISECLDRMEPSSRLFTVRSITSSELATLWTLFEGASLDGSHFVPPSFEPMTNVRHYGKNSLPVFSLFEKRFCRSEGGEVVYGYNHQPFERLVGPGYFVGMPDSAQAGSSFVFDYTKLPERVPPAWPKVIANSARLGRWVYYNTKDYLRKISDHVCVGRLYKKERPENVYFALCRETESG